MKYLLVFVLMVNCWANVSGEKLSASLEYLQANEYALYRAFAKGVDLRFDKGSNISEGVRFVYDRRGVFRGAAKCAGVTCAMIHMKEEALAGEVVIYLVAPIYAGSVEKFKAFGHEIPDYQNDQIAWYLHSKKETHMSWHARVSFNELGLIVKHESLIGPEPDKIVSYFYKRSEFEERKAMISKIKGVRNTDYVVYFLNTPIQVYTRYLDQN